MKTLVLAEKPSVAQDLARVLGIKPGRGAEFFENDKYVISSAVGHLLEIAAPEGSEARGKWKLENLPSLPEHFDLNPIEKNASRLAVIKKLIKRKDVGELINAGDAGREGELIFRNIVRATGAKQPIKRLWLQSMTADAIRAAFAHLRSDAEMLPLADAAVSRSEADWLVGINSTRALTSFNSRGGGFQKTTAGRVQTPTLAILAEREERIRAFEPRAYFEVFADFGIAAGQYRGRWLDEKFDAKKTEDEQAKAERIWDKAQADAIEAKCKGKPGIIEEEKKAASQISPQLYDLTTLQREANGRFGFPARMTLQIAQALYERHKALTYPRTDSRYLPEDHLDTAKKVMGTFSGDLAKHAKRAMQSGWVKPNKRIFNNAKVSDHFAIVPTGTVPHGLDDKEQRIFDLVSKRFVAVFYPPAQFEDTTRITRVEGEAFKTTGRIITDPGWMAVYGREVEGTDSEKAIVPAKPGEQAETLAIEVKESLTKPPARFNEGTLLSAMEGAGKLVDDEELREAMAERGLGTPATRAQTIEGLIYEGYVIRDGRELVVTQKGLSLIILLRNLDAQSLTQPALTGEWEFKLRQMERGKLSRTDFMNEIRRLTTEIVNKVKNHQGGEIVGNFESLEVVCPKCGAKSFRESFKSYTCVNPDCGLTVWKTVASRELERSEVTKLLTEGQVGPLEGFRSKFGRAFSAPLVLDRTEWKVQFDFKKDDEGDGTQPGWVNPEPVGKCRLCETGQVLEAADFFQCDKRAEKKCTFKMSKTILRKNLTRSDCAALLKDGKTALLTGFVSARTGRGFKAFLVLKEDGKVGFEFAAREPKAGTKEVAKPAAKPSAQTARPARKAK
ncbi:MAG: DNA topoisomerase III [Chthoniobacteraceae bacterium]